jgi:hypothetical protein
VKKRFAALASALVLAGCGGTVVETRFADVGDALDPRCVRAVEEAAGIDASRDTVEDLDAAIRACPDFSQFQAAAELFPAALDGAPAEQFVEDRCRFNLELAGAAICSEVGD